MKFSFNNNVWILSAMVAVVDLFSNMVLKYSNPMKSLDHGGGLLDPKPGFVSHVSYQKLKYEKYFFGDSGSK